MGQVIDRKVLQRCTEFCQRTKHLHRILVPRLHPDVKVLRRADVPVRSERVGADNDVVNAVGVERGQ